MPSSDPAAYIGIGFITKAHSIRVEVGVALTAEDPELLSGSIFVRKGRVAPVAHKVAGVRVHHGGLLVRLEGVIDRNAAEALKGSEILIERAKLPPAEDGEFFLDDLIGLRVLYEKAGVETELGLIEAIDTPAGQELWLIRTADGKEVLFPAVPEFVDDIDLEAGRVHITPPPGLLEIYLGE